MTSIINRIAKVRIQGHITLQTEHNLIRVINRMYKSPFSAVAVIINSFGGSIKSSRAISSLLKTYRDEKQIPIYCFAQDFCLNSANLILTMGTKSYANKLSLVGDFNFSKSAYDTDQFQKHFGIRQIQISKMNISKIKNNPLYYTNVEDQKFLSLMANEQYKEFVQQIIENRKNQLKLKCNDQKQLLNKLLNKSIVDPYDAMEFGFIDDVLSFETFVESTCKGARISERNKNKFAHPIMNMVYEINMLLQSK